jgi:hypothetical protein
MAPLSNPDMVFGSGGSIGLTRREIAGVCNFQTLKITRSPVPDTVSLQNHGSVIYHSLILGPGCQTANGGSWSKVPRDRSMHPLFVLNFKYRTFDDQGLLFFSVQGPDLI